MSFVELRGPKKTFRTDKNKCLNGRHLGYAVYVINITEEDEILLEKNKSMNFMDIAMKLSQDLQKKISDVSPKTLKQHQTGHKFNYNYYCINPLPLLPHIYIYIEK